MEITRVTGLVTVLDILADTSPALLTEEETHFRGGKRRFTQKVSVPDAELLRQLCATVRKGDKIEVTVTTEWHEAHSVVYLSAFQHVSAPLPALEAMSVT